MRAHQVHQAKAIIETTSKVRTYDQPAGGRQPDGHDEHPAGTRWIPDGDGLRSESIEATRTPWWEVDDTTRSYVGAQTCPDCGRGLRSLGEHGMICTRLPLDERLEACHPGCIVACGGDDE